MCQVCTWGIVSIYKSGYPKTNMILSNGWPHNSSQNRYTLPDTFLDSYFLTGGHVLTNLNTQVWSRAVPVGRSRAPDCYRILLLHRSWPATRLRTVSRPPSTRYSQFPCVTQKWGVAIHLKIGHSHVTYVTKKVSGANRFSIEGSSNDAPQNIDRDCKTTTVTCFSVSQPWNYIVFAASAVRRVRSVQAGDPAPAHGQPSETRAPGGVWEGTVAGEVR